MSGEGLISVRLPGSLLAAFQAARERQGITAHEAARRLLSWLSDLSGEDLRALGDPSTEQDAPRLSLYVGWPGVDRLDSAVRRSGLSRSAILRRLLYGLLVSGSLQYVQLAGKKRLQRFSVQSHSRDVAKPAVLRM